MENVRGQPRGDGSWITAVRVSSLLNDAFLRSSHGSHVGAVTSDGVGLRSTGNLGGSILGWGSCRHCLVDTFLSLVPRRSFDGSRRLLSPWHVFRQRHPSRRVQFTGVGNFCVSAILYATFRVFLQTVYIRTAATLAARWSRRSSLLPAVVRRAGPFLKFERMYRENDALKWSAFIYKTKMNDIYCISFKFVNCHLILKRNNRRKNNIMKVVMEFNSIMQLKKKQNVHIFDNSPFLIFVNVNFFI